MRSRATDIAIESLLLLIAVTCLLMGAVSAGSLILGIYRHPLELLLVADVALATLTVGVGLLAIVREWPRARQVAGVVLALLALHALGLNVVHPAEADVVSATAEHRHPSALGAMILLLVAACLVAGCDSHRHRRLWLAVGLLLMALGLQTALGILFPDLALSSKPYNSAPLVVALFCGAVGLAAVLLGLYGHRPRRGLDRLALLALVAGIGLSCASWVLLMNRDYRELSVQAEFLLDNVQVTAEKAVRERLNLVRRMAERVDASDGELDHRVLARDIGNYLEDAQSLQGIGQVNADLSLKWQVSRDENGSAWIDAMLALPSVRQWLATSYPHPRLILPEEHRQNLALLAVGLPAINSHLVAGLALDTLLADALQLQLGQFQVRVLRGDKPMLALQPKGAGTAHFPIRQMIAHRHVGLPGGLTIGVEIHPAHTYGWQRISLVPAGVSTAGLTLSWMLAFSLAMTGLARGNMRQAVAAQAHAGFQQSIQGMIVREASLPDTLDIVCDMVESQLTDSLCAVMLADSDGRVLALEAGGRLPPDLAAALERIDIAATGPACAVAAAHREPVVITDGAALGCGYAAGDALDRSGIRACWSWPVTANDGGLLGTVDVYRRVPGDPDDALRTLVHKAAELVSLAVERQRSARLLRMLGRSVEASINGIAIADASQPDMPLVYINPAFTRITGYTSDEVIGRNCRFLQGPDTDTGAVAELRSHLSAEREVHVRLRNYRKDGTGFWNDLYISPVRSGAGDVTHYVGVLHDVSEQVDYETQLAHHATHDVLTELPNRALFEDRLVHDFSLANRRGEGVAVLFVDLDDFKPINDTLGHGVGDQVLREVAHRLVTSVRSGDTVARLGGDEFVVLMPSVDGEEQVVSLVERLLLLLARPYRILSHELYLTASVGIALSEPDMGKPQQLIQQADMAMYRAKQQGRNAYQFFTREITERVTERMVMRNELQEAIPGNQFELHYQPLVTRDGTLAGIEALLRWNHPERGYVPPDVFIPVAEATGQIIAISEWVLDRAGRDSAALQRAGRGDVRVAVNVSAMQFHRPHFLANLRRSLQSTGLAPEHLELELTERILMDDTETAIDILHALRSLKVSVSIDDFGTGYSSLSYLKTLPINKVKIDRSFTREVTTSASDAAIVQGIISMAHHLGLQVVAEGVETREQWQCLADFGCDIFQGYLLARPMPLEQLERFVDNGCTQNWPPVSE